MPKRKQSNNNNTNQSRIQGAKNQMKICVAVPENHINSSGVLPFSQLFDISKMRVTLLIPQSV